MRSARVILATAAAAAVIGMGAPGAFAAGSDWEKEDSGYSKKEDSGWSKEESSKEESSKEDSGYSKEESSKEEYSKEEESGYLEKHPEDAGKSKDDYGKPHGGVHTGGGALMAVNEGDWGTAKDPKHDPETYKDKDKDKEKDSEWSKEDSGYSKEDSWGEKPSGGVHTGGGGLAAPSVTTGGVAVLGVAAVGLYAARRKKTAGSVA